MRGQRFPARRAARRVFSRAACCGLALAFAGGLSPVLPAEAGGGKAATVAGQAKDTPAPPAWYSPTAPTWAESCGARIRDWYAGHFRDGLERMNVADPEVRRAMGELFDAVAVCLADLGGSGRYEALLARQPPFARQEDVDAADPVYLFALHWLGQWIHPPRSAAHVRHRNLAWAAASRFTDEAKDWPPLPLALLRARILPFTLPGDGPQRKKNIDWVNEHLLKALRAAPALAEADQEVLWADGYANIFQQGFRNASEECAKTIREEKLVGPWLSDMLDGKYEYKAAWDARGTDYAYKTKDEQWEKYRAHSKKSYRAFEAAHKRRPDWPYAAAELIGVAVGHKDGKRDFRHWFVRSVAACFDYLPAYRNYRHWLWPRWFGSLDEMAEFGAQCVATGRFDTFVPLYAFHQFESLCNEVDRNNDRPELRAKIHERLSPLFDAAWRGYLAAAKSPHERALVWRYRATFARQNGIWREAVESYRQSAGLPASENPRLPRWNSDIDGPVLARQHADFIAALLEPENESLREAWTAYRARDMARAESLLAEIAPRLPPGSPRRTRVLDLFGYARMYAAEQARKEAGTNPGHVFSCWESPPASFAYALIHGKIDVALALLEGGIDLDALGYPPNDLLDRALYYRQPAVFDALLARGAPATENTSTGYPPIYTGLYRAGARVIDPLLAAGARLDGEFGPSGRPLVHAASRASDGGEALRTLLKRGADVNATDRCYGDTGLHSAVAARNSGAARAFIEEGADISARNKRGLTPTELAEENKNRPLAEFLETTARERRDALRWRYGLFGGGALVGLAAVALLFRRRRRARAGEVEGD